MDNLTYYKEVQGVMVRFEPLTDAALQAAAEDGLTVSEIRSALERHGLDFKYVVHDPSRTMFSTYYADYDRGLYGEIFLQRDLLEGPLPLYEAAARLNGEMVPQLVSQQWASYYTKCVPLPMLPYDFQRRYRDIPPGEVFQVWHSIYKRIDYSNGVWRPVIYALRDLFIRFFGKEVEALRAFFIEGGLANAESQNHPIVRKIEP